MMSAASALNWASTVRTMHGDYRLRAGVARVERRCVGEDRKGVSSETRVSARDWRRKKLGDEARLGEPRQLCVLQVVVMCVLRTPPLSE